MQDNQNPFDDPDVQAAAVSAAAPVVTAAASDPAVQSAVWEASKNAYSSGSDPKSTIASDPNVQSAVMGAAIGHYTGSSKAPPPPPPSQTRPNDDGAYDDNGWDPEANQPKDAPEEKTFMGACVGFCGWFSAILPLRYALITFGLLLIVAGLVDYITNFKTALDLFINTYLIGFGIIIVFIECPRMTWNRMVQEGILYWAYFLARLWGRAMLYIFLCILCVSDPKSPAKMVIGIVGFFLCFLMYFVAWNAANKMKRINIWVSQAKEGDDRLKLIEMKFNDLSKGMTSIGQAQIVEVATEADRELSFSEREAILRFFNPDFTNDIELHEWHAGFEICRKGLRML